MLELVVVVRRARSSSRCAAWRSRPPRRPPAPCTKTWSAVHEHQLEHGRQLDSRRGAGRHRRRLHRRRHDRDVVNTAVTVRAIRSERPLRNSAALTLTDATEPSTFTDADLGTHLGGRRQWRAATP